MTAKPKAPRKPGHPNDLILGWQRVAYCCMSGGTPTVRLNYPVYGSEEIAALSRWLPEALAWAEYHEKGE